MYWEFGIDMNTLLYLKQIINKDLLHSTGNCSIFCGRIWKRIDTGICTTESSRFSFIYFVNSLLSLQFSSVAQSCSALCDIMNFSMPGLPVHHNLPEATQTHVHWIGDAIQPSHPLSSPSPPALNPSQHQCLFQWVNTSWGGQSTGVSTLASVLPKNTQGWSPLEWTGWIL